MLGVNLFGALHVMQQAVRVMRRQGHGHIVNVASLAGRRGFSPLGGYCATKFALIGMTEALRMELVGERHPRLAGDARSGGHASRDDRATRRRRRRCRGPSNSTCRHPGSRSRIFLAIRFRLAEIAVPPGSALVEKLAALAPGTTDSLLRWATGAAQRAARVRSG